MKIAVISNGARSLLNFRGPLLAEMVRRGHSVIAFAPDHDETSRAALAGLGVEAVDYRLSRAGTNPLSEFSTVMALRRMLKQHRPDIAFSYVIKPVVYGSIAAWLAGVPRRYGMIEGLGFSFIDEHSISFRRKLLQWSVSSLLRFAGRLVERMIFLNNDDLSEFVNRSIVPRERAHLLGGIGVDLAGWRPIPFPDEPVTFILVARLLRDKGIAEYIQAAAILRNDYPDVRIILLGGLDDNPAAITRAEVEAWVAQGLVEWPGHTDVRPWLAQAHVFVLPSYYREGVPRSTQEAMAMGRPIITTDAPGCRETAVDGVNGFMVSPRDPVALAAAMRRFVENPELIAPMGRESRRMAEERFDVHQQNAKLLAMMGL